MAVMKYHGGGCCGVRHIHAFRGDETVQELKDQIDRGSTQANTRGMLVEAVLTGHQLRRYPSLGPVMKEVGFRLVSRFINPNTGNMCNVFHYNQFPKKFTRKFGGVDREMVGGNL